VPRRLRSVDGISAKDRVPISNRLANRSGRVFGDLPQCAGVRRVLYQQSESDRRFLRAAQPSWREIELSDGGGHVVDAVKYGDHAPWPLAAMARERRSNGFARRRSRAPRELAASMLPRLSIPAGTPGRQMIIFNQPAAGDFGRAIQHRPTGSADHGCRRSSGCRWRDKRGAALQHAAAHPETPEISLPMILQPAIQHIEATPR